MFDKDRTKFGFKRMSKGFNTGTFSSVTQSIDGTFSPPARDIFSPTNSTISGADNMLDTISTQMMNSTFMSTPEGEVANTRKTTAFISSLTIMENQFLQITGELLSKEYKKQHEGNTGVADHILNR